jgi:hypothetical protein
LQSSAGEPISIKYARQLKVSNNYILGGVVSELGASELVMHTGNIYARNAYNILSTASYSVNQHNWVKVPYRANIVNSAGTQE